HWMRWLTLGLGLATLVCAIATVMAMTGGLDTSTTLGRLFLDGRIPTGQGRAPITNTVVNSTGFWALISLLVLEGAFALWMRRRVAQVLAVVEKRARDLAMLANVLDRLEKGRFESALLARLHKELTEATGDVPSQRIAQLSNLIDTLNSRRNAFFA